MNRPPSEGFRRLIPPQDLDAILVYVARCWEVLRRQMPTQHAYQENERRLTISLTERLNDIDTKEAFGINGSFAPEPVEPQRRGKEIVEAGRSDIRFTLGADRPPEIILEFKKLDGTPEARRRYMDDGVSRFVEGKYAKQHYHGIVIGLSREGRAAELPVLEAHIEAAGDDPVFAFRREVNGTFVRRPSVLAPVHSDFGTEHDRIAEAGPSPIMLAHLVLDCPVDPAYVPLQERVEIIELPKRGRGARRAGRR